MKTSSEELISVLTTNQIARFPFCYPHPYSGCHCQDGYLAPAHGNSVGAITRTASTECKD